MSIIDGIAERIDQDVDFAGQPAARSADRPGFGAKNSYAQATIREPAVMKFRVLRNGLSVQFFFQRPIFAWDGVSGRFLTMLFDSLSPKIVVRASEISLQPAIALGDVRVRYSIFGGASSITLFSDRLAFEFPVLTNEDYPVALEILHAIHDAFPKTFPEQQYERIEVQALDHLDLMDVQQVNEFLDRYRLPNVEEVFKSAGAGQMPSVRVTVVSEREGWQCTLSAERSVLAATAIFVLRVLTLSPIKPSSSFSEKLELARSVALRFLSALDLEFADGAATKRG